MKLALIGTGRIVHDALFAMEELQQVEKTAIFARPHSLATAQALAEQYGIREVYTDYDELLEKTQADTVYIGLVNSAHFEYTKKALEHGKHVILEKPFVPTYEQALELEKLAESSGKYLLEAITVLHIPVFDEIQRNLPKLGAIRALQLNFSQYSSRYDRYLQGDVDYCLNPEYQGGALYDINVYNVHYCVGLFGRPKTVAYYPHLGFNAVDTSGLLILQYDGFSAVCLGAKDSDSPGYVTIQGEQGYMKMTGSPNAGGSLLTDAVCGEAAKERSASGATVRKTRTETYQQPPTHHRMTREFADFAAIVDNEDAQTADRLLHESVEVVRVLELAKQSAPGMWGE